MVEVSAELAARLDEEIERRASRCCDGRAWSSRIARAVTQHSGLTAEAHGRASTFARNDDRRSQSSFARASRSALPITLTEDSAIAAAPTIGDSRMPNTG